MEVNYLKTTKQVAQMLECTTRNVTLKVSKGKLNPVLVLENGFFLFDVNDVEQYLLNTLNR